MIKIILGHSAHVVYGFRVRAPDPAPAHHRPADPAQGDCRERKVQEIVAEEKAEAWIQIHIFHINWVRGQMRFRQH